MAHQLTDAQIQVVCREVLAREPAPSGRSLRRALRARYGGVGRTDRVYAIWHQMSRGGQETLAVTDVERQRWLARIQAAEDRARLAEERELRHQDHWASEVHALRERLRLQQGTLSSGVPHETYHRVHRELQRLRTELARLKGEA